VFTWLNKQGVASDEGFALQFTGRFSAEYSADGTTIELYVESGLSGGKQAILYTSSEFRKWSNNPDEQRIAEDNFRRAMEFQGLIPIDE
jgi:hypothetical protein